ncbi:MAG: hypothetical protein FWE22_08660 [Firmicutes bacterium]|nr:hypothetical protein [Bacillota bacterium]
MKKLGIFILVVIFFGSILLFVVGLTTDVLNLNDYDEVVTRQDLENARQQGFNQGFQLGTRELQTFRDRIEELENEVEYWQDRYYSMREYLEGIIRDLNEQILSQMSHVDVLHNVILQLVEYGLGDLVMPDSLDFLQSLEQIYVMILGQIESDITYLEWWLDEVFPIVYNIDNAQLEVNQTRLERDNIVSEIARLNQLIANYLREIDRGNLTYGDSPIWVMTRAGIRLTIGLHEINRDRYRDELLPQTQYNYDNALIRLIHYNNQRAIAEHLLDGQITARADFETRLNDVRERIENKGGGL